VGFAVKNSILFLFFLVACGSPDPIDHYEMNKLSERVTDLNNQIGILQTQVAEMDVQLKIIQGTQNVYVDNYIGMKIKFDLLAKDVCPKCDFEIREPKPQIIQVTPTPEEQKDIDEALKHPLD
jgi:hypothetical protein